MSFLEWDTTLCPDGETCATACALDGADYKSTYGISSSGDELSLQFVTGCKSFVVFALACR